MRADTELARVEAARGRAHDGRRARLLEAVEAALCAARATGGLVDPSAATAAGRGAAGRRACAAAAPRRPDRRIEPATARPRRSGCPPGVHLDLGATGKALIADRAAARIAAARHGRLVSVGGDLATAGPAPRERLAGPRGRRPPRDRRRPAASACLRRAGDLEHDRPRAGAHIVDPRDGRPAAGPWRTASVAAATCVDANAASTAAIVLGDAAPEWLERAALPALLVAHDGATVRVAGWPEARVAVTAVLAAGTPALWYLTRGTGAVTLSCSPLSVVLGILEVERWSAPGAPRFMVAALHRSVSLLVLALLAVHVLTAVLDTFAPIRLLDAVVPFAGVYRPLWLGLGALALDVLLAVMITSLVRRRLGLRAWRAVHWLAYALWPRGRRPRARHRLGREGVVDAGPHGGLRRGRVGAIGWRLGGRGPGRRGVRAGAGARRAGGRRSRRAVGCRSGPLAPGWARRSGTPAALLAPRAVGRAAPPRLAPPRERASTAACRLAAPRAGAGTAAPSWTCACARAAARIRVRMGGAAGRGRRPRDVARARSTSGRPATPRATAAASPARRARRCAPRRRPGAAHAAARARAPARHGTGRRRPASLRGAGRRAPGCARPRPPAPAGRARTRPSAPRPSGAT